MARVTAVTLGYILWLVRLSAATESTDGLTCTSTVDTSWEKHVRTVYVQQWRGSDNARFVLDRVFNAPRKRWNDTFSRLDGVQPHNQRASCPWDYTTDYDEKRIPQFIPMAVCRCKYCSESVSGESRPDVRCTPVTYRLPVLRQEDGFECHHGRLKYSPVTINVPVACACLRNSGRPGRGRG